MIIEGQMKCDTDRGPEFQCPNNASAVLVDDYGDVTHLCQPCRDYWDEIVQEINQIGSTASGIPVFVNAPERGVETTTVE